MFVTAKVKGGTRENAIFVPQLAVQQGANGHVVYVVKEDGPPSAAGGRRRLLRREGHLHPHRPARGDRVVVDGAMRVVPASR